MKFKVPFLHNVRRGLATNSSSSHSLVYFATDRPYHDDDVSNVDSAEFGWDIFKLTTKRQKLTYALTAILQREGHNVGWLESEFAADDADAAMKEYIKKFPHLEDVVKIAASGYIDHQSVVSNPAELIKAALDPKVEIWGGNDNGGDPHEGGYGPGIVRVEYLG